MKKVIVFLLILLMVFPIFGISEEKKIDYSFTSIGMGINYPWGMEFFLSTNFKKSPWGMYAIYGIDFKEVNRIRSDYEIYSNRHKNMFSWNKFSLGFNYTFKN